MPAILKYWTLLMRWDVSLYHIPKFTLSQSEAVSTVLTFCDIKHWLDVAECGCGKYLFSTPWWYIRFVCSRHEYVSPKHEPWLDQTLLICRWELQLGVKFVLPSKFNHDSLEFTCLQRTSNQFLSFPIKLAILLQAFRNSSVKETA